VQEALEDLRSALYSQSNGVSIRLVERAALQLNGAAAATQPSGPCLWRASNIGSRFEAITKGYSGVYSWISDPAPHQKTSLHVHGFILIVAAISALTTLQYFTPPLQYVPILINCATLGAKPKSCSQTEDFRSCKP